MASLDLTLQDDDSSDLGLTTAQLTALERLDELGARPREPGDKWDSDPQIRAYQMMFEGKIGGSGTKSGVSARKKHERAAAGVAEHVRNKLQRKMTDALDRALAADAGSKVNLDAIKLALDIEHKEDELSLKEEAQDAELDNAPKEELIAALFEIVTNSATAPYLEGTVEEIKDAFVVSDEEPAEVRSPSHPRKVRTKRVTTSVNNVGGDPGNAGQHGQGKTRLRRPPGAPPLKKVKRRRATN